MEREEGKGVVIEGWDVAFRTESGEVIQHIFFIPRRDQLFFSVEFEQEVQLNSVDLNFWPDYYLIPTCEIKIDSSKAEKYIREE